MNYPAAGYYYPASHVLGKSTGQAIICSWSAHNSGNGAGEVILRLVNLTQDNSVIAVSNPVLVNPGQQVAIPLVLSGLQAGQAVELGTNNMRLDMILLRAEGNLYISGHSFVVQFAL